jgi:hypothetical protein
MNYKIKKHVVGIVCEGSEIYPLEYIEVKKK